MQIEKVNKTKFKYLQKYYDILDEYESPVRDREGEPTGETQLREGIPVIKKEFVEVREISSEGLDLVNEKYRKLFIIRRKKLDALEKNIDALERRLRNHDRFPSEWHEGNWMKGEAREGNDIIT